MYVSQNATIVEKTDFKVEALHKKTMWRKNVFLLSCKIWKSGLIPFVWHITLHIVHWKLLEDRLKFYIIIRNWTKLQTSFWKSSSQIHTRLPTFHLECSIWETHSSSYKDSSPCKKNSIFVVSHRLTTQYESTVRGVWKFSIQSSSHSHKAD